jgi:DUF4097 and DUF4098 domain-containing protein YvlB
MRPAFGILLAAAIAAPADAEVTDRLTRTVPLARGTPIHVQVTIGEVKVTGWDRAAVEVEIVRRAPSAAAFARFPATVETSATGLAVRAVQADGGRDAALRADVTLRVPVSARLAEVDVFEGGLALDALSGWVSARLERGDITADVMSGVMRLETAIGDIRVSRARLRPDGLIRLRTFNGNVSVALAERPADARVLALSLNGTIASDVPLNRQERWGPRWAEATIGKGEPVISIDVVNGNIDLRIGAR